MRNLIRLSVAAPLLAACSAPQPPLRSRHDEPPTISTNRPSFSDSASLVPSGHVQIETGYTFTKRDRDGVATENHAVPETLGRCRLLDRVEAQLLWGGCRSLETTSGNDSSNVHGASDLGVGVRVALADQDGMRPQLSVGGIATVGGGADAFSAGEHVIPTGKLLWAYSFDGGHSLGGNFIASRAHDGQERFDQLAVTLVGAVAVAERTTLFGECYAVAPYANGEGTAHTVDAGVLYLLRRTVQLDARVGFGLNAAAEDFFAGCGISFLF